MSNNNVTAQCPFYERENRTTIFCETNFEEEGMFSARVFSCERDKLKFMRAHCARYPDMGCQYADYMNQVYAEGENHEWKNQKEKEKTGACRGSGKRK